MPPFSVLSAKTTCGSISNVACLGDNVCAAGHIESRVTAGTLRASRRPGSASQYRCNSVAAACGSGAISQAVVRACE